MATTRDYSDLLRLTVLERMKLIEELWDSISAETGALPLTDQQRQEVDRRLEEHERDPSTAIPWEEARKRLRARYG
jgi:putative addiction module component (TIGR02574 family)